MIWATGGWRWLAVDVVWATAGGLLIGGALGALIGTLVVYLRSRHGESVGLDEFLALGLIALAYGVAVLGHAYGFLAGLRRGLALQRVKEGVRPGPSMRASGVTGRRIDRPQTSPLPPSSTPAPTSCTRCGVSTNKWSGSASWPWCWWWRDAAVHPTLDKRGRVAGAAVPGDPPTVSIVLHGVSVRPIMHLFRRRKLQQDL